jgi:hypothetical protein
LSFARGGYPISLPWDLANLLPNLQTLAQVQPGDRLSVLKEGDNPGSHDPKRGLRDRFVIKSKLKHGVVSLIKGEKFLDDDAYLTPLETLFREAVQGVQAGRSSNGTLLRAAHVQVAYDGLKRLRDGYKRAKHAKADEIVRRVGAVVAPLVCEPGTTRTWDLLAAGQGFSLRGWLTNNAGNAGVTQEHPIADPTEQANFVNAVYGNAPPQPAVRMAATGQQYQRAGTGVCHQFWIDGIDRPSITLNGAPQQARSLNQAAANVRALYQQLGNDEAMLFAVSQISCQVGLSSLPGFLLTFTTYYNSQQGQPSPLVVHRGKELVPALGPGGANVTFPQGANGTARVEVDVNLQGTAGCSELVNGQHGAGASLVSFGLSGFTMRLAVDVSRRGNSINLNLVRAEYQLSST